VLALIPWGLAIEDFLHPNGLALEDLCREFTGSWMFGYAEALRAAGVEVVIVCVSSGVGDVVRTTHQPTGVPLCLVPLPRRIRLLRRFMRNPYGRTIGGTFRIAPPLRQLLAPLLFVAKELAPYSATPIRAVARELAHYRCDAVLCQEYEFPRFDILVALGQRLGVPVFGTFQGGDYQRWRLEQLTRPPAMRRSAGMIIASPAEIERVRRRYRVPAHKIAPIANPVDLRSWQPGDRETARAELGIPPSARVAAWHGRIEVWKKGLDTLVEAWATVTEARPSSELALLVIGGGGDGVDAFRRLLRERALPNVVWIDRHLHDRARLAHLLSAADVYVFPSRQEGSPLSPMEAMACGLPVVASDVSAVRAVVVGGGAPAGVVVPVDDSAALARELGTLLDSVALTEELGRAARARTAALDSAHVGNELRQFLFGSGAE
jgi:glycosyltransferase involved in cell wall biosynthesis